MTDLSPLSGANRKSDFGADRSVDDPQRSSGRLRGTGALWNIDSGSALLRLDVEGPDDVAPLLGFVGNEFSEFGRCH